VYQAKLPGYERGKLDGRIIGRQHSAGRDQASRLTDTFNRNIRRAEVNADPAFVIWQHAELALRNEHQIHAQTPGSLLIGLDSITGRGRD
jgi:hypothetical protein